MDAVLQPQNLTDYIYSDKSHFKIIWCQIIDLFSQ